MSTLSLSRGAAALASAGLTLAALAAAPLPALAQGPSSSLAITSIPPAGPPKFHPISKTAKALMAHAPKPNYYRLAQKGNLVFKGKVSFACAKGDYVEQVYFARPGDPVRFVYKHGGAKKQFISVEAKLTPWSVKQFEAAGRSALIGAWSPAAKPYSAKSGKIPMSSKYSLMANCAKNKQTQKVGVGLKIMLTAIDTQY